MRKQDVSKYVGKQIRHYRTLRHMTQRELGLRLGVQHNTVSSWESGINEPDQNMLFSIAKVLGISIDDLFPSDGSDKNQHKGTIIGGHFSKYPVSNITMIPVVGKISCGNGIPAFEEIESYEPTPKEWLNGGEFFYLRARGDSMIGARIHEGDLLLIRKQPEVENGEIAVVLIGDEAVLKRVYKSDGQLILQSENPTYPPILAPPAEVCIIGKLKMNVIRY